MLLTYIYYLLTSLLIFQLGGSFASFFTALIYRIEARLPYRELATKGSFCEECKKDLKWYEMVPFFSYLVFKGRCSRCGYKIPLSYPVGEFLLGAAFVALYFSEIRIESFIVLSALYFLALYDFYFQGFPKVIMHFYLALGAITSIILMLIDFQIAALYSVGFSFIASGVILLINKVKESFGTGDILVFIFLGFLIRVDQLITTLLLSIFIGAFVGVILILSGKATRKSRIPFVPFIWSGYFLSFFLTKFLLRYFEVYF